MRKTKIFPAQLSKLPQMIQYIQTPIKEFHLVPIWEKKIQIALEEALVNIIHYAYPEKQGNIEISYEIEEEKKIIILIKDQGIPFNPLKNASSVAGYIPIKERKVGGLGISFILNIMDEIDYQRIGNSNQLKLSKYFHHGQSIQ